LTGENESTRREARPNAVLPTIDSAWNTLGKNLGIRGRKPAFNHLSTACIDVSEINTKFLLKNQNKNATYESCV
jgi:hypothetical protein